MSSGKRRFEETPDGSIRARTPGVASTQQSSEQDVEGGERGGQRGGQCGGQRGWQRSTTPVDSSSLQRSSKAESAHAGQARESEGGDRFVDYEPGPDRSAMSERYGFAVREGTGAKLQRLEDDFGTDQVDAWAAEGMPVETMGRPRSMAAFRQRQADRPDAVPADVERQNAASVQRNARTEQSDGPAGDAGVPDVVRDVISSQGTGLDEPVQREMEGKMGTSFEDVRVHTGPRAAAAADAIDARAFTVGNHVAFNDGEYDPGSPDGKRVLAHELTHVRQQSDGRVRALPKADGLAIDPDPTLEREAETVADRVVDDGSARTGTTASAEPGVQRIGAGLAEAAGNLVPWGDEEEEEDVDPNVALTESELQDFLAAEDPSMPPGVPVGANELIFHVHGFQNSVPEGMDKVRDIASSFAEAGSDAEISGLAWDSGSGPWDWWEAKSDAVERGQQLGQFLMAYASRAENRDTTIVLEGHSLGSRVVLEALVTLHENGATDVVDTAVLQAGAVDRREVAMDERYGEAIESTVGSVHNYLSEDDTVLGWAFWAAETGSEAIGKYGAPEEGTTPENWQDHDVTGEVEGHKSGSYFSPEFLEEFVLPYI